MNNQRGLLASVLILLVCVVHLPAQSSDPAPTDELNTPGPVNLDLPPEIPADPAQEQEEELGREAIESPDTFHNWLLEVEPQRRAAELLAALALLHPDAFERAHPKTPDQAQAAAIASHAILNPHFPSPSESN